nr:DUF3106 domain-containing protein [Rubrivivax benzoatilyticus]
MSAAQRRALAPLQQDWPNIDSTGKERWLSVAARFPKMSQAERQRVQERMAAWTQMTPSERARARLQFQQVRQLSAEDRQARWDAYRALPDDQRKQLAERAVPPKRTPSRVREGDDEDGKPKRNIVTSPRPPSPKPVAPAVIQAAPGATTTLITSRPSSPAHHQSGMPKIIATDDFVNPVTMLPRRGPQGAAVRSQAASEPR